MTAARRTDTGFVPCSVRHRACSRAHATPVRDYREERERQETEHEMVLTSPAEKKLWQENGGKLIDFHDWLVANKRIDRNEKWD